MTEGTLNATESDQIEFANDHFVRGQPDLIHQIKRKDTKRLVTRVNNGDRMINSSQLSDLLQELSEQVNFTFFFFLTFLAIFGVQNNFERQKPLSKDLT